MGIMAWLIIICIAGILTTSLIGFVRGGKIPERMQMQESRFSAEIFYTLLIIYLVVIIGFGLVYFVLSMSHVLLVENSELRDESIVGSLMRSIYFSGVTLLTIGYGDITPIGIGRLIALVQALIGYVLPAAFVLKLVQNNQDNRERKKDML
ncbi:potassium channel family protein [Lentibacillus salinarum]|uniref:Potassium channel family protein n=1 Tax=Lentibacillus salinarum TaxID=446820 RepID=A0ABW3ZQQ8_9BACI